MVNGCPGTLAFSASSPGVSSPQNPQNGPHATCPSTGWGHPGPLRTTAHDTELPNACCLALQRTKPKDWGICYSFPLVLPPPNDRFTISSLWENIFELRIQQIQKDDKFEKIFELGHVRSIFWVTSVTSCLSLLSSSVCLGRLGQRLEPQMDCHHCSVQQNPNDNHRHPIGIRSCQAVDNWIIIYIYIFIYILSN